jgi:hypothetical protein
MRGILVSLLVVGCTNSGGSVSGGGFDVADTISAAVTLSDGTGGTSSSAMIVMASTSNLCSDAGASPPIDRKQQRYVVIELSDVMGGMTATPTAPGTYTIYPNTGTRPAKSASLVTGGFDGTCQPTDATAGSGESGSVTLTSIAGGVFDGTFDVALNTGSHITGSFTPHACPALATEQATMTTHSCQ